MHAPALARACARAPAIADALMPPVLAIKFKGFRKYRCECAVASAASKSTLRSDQSEVTDVFHIFGHALASLYNHERVPSFRHHHRLVNGSLQSSGWRYFNMFPITRANEIYVLSGMPFVGV